MDSSDKSSNKNKQELKAKKKAKKRNRNQKKALKKKLRKEPAPKSERIISAKKWLNEYDESTQGKNIIKKYRKHFRVTPQCALQEIQELGYPLTDEQIRKFHEVKRNKIIQEKNKKRKRRERLQAKREAKKLGKEFEMFHDSDDNFFFIVGHTSGGAPYGVTWEEMGLEPYQNLFDDEDDIFQ